MTFIADLHIHSHYSRATSKQLNLEHLNKWAQLKGVQVVATGDFTHPEWLDELMEKLEPAEDGLFKLKPDFRKATQDEVFKSCENPVRFILSTEISNIYKKGEKVRKVHNVVIVPSFDAAKDIQGRLDKIGNIRSDGRPILGLDSRDLLEIVLEAGDGSALIPAHIWTPWFSAMGSKSGFDSIEECYDDLSEHIFAVETGLSSDPPMNWRVSSLDKYTLVSNSDAHSPQKLARESNIFLCDMSFPAMLDAMKTGAPEKFGGTIEFFPEEGKYHYDGHRKCEARMSPEETLAHNGKCPVCGKDVTRGVSYRIEELADRKPGEKSLRALPFESLIPLPEIIAEVMGRGPNTKGVREKYEKMLSQLGSELHILRDITLSELEKSSGSLLAEGIRRMRESDLQIDAGYDGEFGTIKIFTARERENFGTKSLFIDKEIPEKKSEKQDKREPYRVKDADLRENILNVFPVEKANGLPEEKRNPYGLNDKQLSAVTSVDHNLVIVAGPGTGKTRTLTYRIAYLIQDEEVDPSSILALTFTNKAAQEMRSRLGQLFEDDVMDVMTIQTFHAFGASILKNDYEAVGYKTGFSILNDNYRKDILKRLGKDLTTAQLKQLMQDISDAKSHLLLPEEADLDAAAKELYALYQKELRRQNLFDFDDLIMQPFLLFRERDDLLKKYREKYKWISVDEYQDINFPQYSLLKLLVTPESNLCVIGDPDQAIYGFRGSDAHYFLTFEKDFPEARTVFLDKNYRSDRSILSASGQVIEKNPERSDLKLWTDMISEDKIEIFRTATEKAEAETIVHRIEKLIGATSFFSVDSGRAAENDETVYGVGFGDIAVLYRLHAQLPALEEAFIRSGIPYQSIGEVPFWERKEPGEILSYLRIIQNPWIDFDLYRVLNNPPRGIGEQTIAILSKYKRMNDLSLWDAIRRVDRISALSATQQQPVASLVDKINRLRTYAEKMSTKELIVNLLKISGMSAYYRNDGKRSYYWEEISRMAEAHKGSLKTFLESIVLQGETDIYDERSERVTLMSIHASKGLEFPVVFITGCEDGILPRIKDEDTEEELHEERRIFYVGMTRAQHKLIFTLAKTRFMYGKQEVRPTSRFLNDIEEELLENKKNVMKKKRSTAEKDGEDSQLSLF
ncbi:MAG: UvrD-helicase domain-containing protein [candidate division KSB1 bacterium]|jgi:uncharacterized protein (TIGR00375 family)|nr:UvrD-helicase domain-containing protein [candidate division KSB1 bacterium]